MLGLAALGDAAAPQPANAWWAGGGYCCGVGIGLVLPPVVIAPPLVYAPAPVYAQPPAYYAPGYAYAPVPQRIWIPAHWQGGYWVQGHWR